MTALQPLSCWKIWEEEPISMRRKCCERPPVIKSENLVSSPAPDLVKLAFIPLSSLYSKLTLRETPEPAASEAGSRGRESRGQQEQPAPSHLPQLYP